MTVHKIIAAIDKEIAALTQARAILAGGIVKRKPGRPKAESASIAPVKTKKKKRNLTPEGRAKIAGAVKARWARQKKAGK